MKVAPIIFFNLLNWIWIYIILEEHFEMSSLSKPHSHLTSFIHDIYLLGHIIYDVYLIISVIDNV